MLFQAETLNFFQSFLPFLLIKEGLHYQVIFGKGFNEFVALIFEFEQMVVFSMVVSYFIFVHWVVFFNDLEIFHLDEIKLLFEVLGQAIVEYSGRECGELIIHYLVNFTLNFVFIVNTVYILFLSNLIYSLSCHFDSKVAFLGLFFRIVTQASFKSSPTTPNLPDASNATHTVSMATILWLFVLYRIV